MSQIDFAIAILLMISVLTYSAISVSNKLTTDFNMFTEKRLEESASTLSKQLFDAQDNKSLISNFKKFQVSLLEIGDYPHTETINITIMHSVGKIYVYDNFFEEVPSNKIDEGFRINVSFDLTFSPNERKYAYIFYEGVPSDSISYESNITETNITSTIVSEEGVYVLSQERCQRLRELSYEQARNEFGFLDNFNVPECEYGPAAPLTSSVIIRNVPLLIEGSDERIYPAFAVLKVW